MDSKLFTLVVVVMFAFACTQPNGPVAEDSDSDSDSGPALERLGIVELEGTPLPFSEAVRVGRTLYLSGKVGRVPETGKLAEGGIGPETRQTLENIRATLEKHGSSLDQVASCVVYLADMEEWPAMNEVYRTFFASGFPARSALGASGLALGARVEITCIAVMEH